MNTETIFVIDGQELTNSTKIKYDQANPKRPGTQIAKDYEQFKKCTTLAQLIEARPKHWRADVKFDYEHGYLMINGKRCERPLGRKAQAELKAAALSNK